MVWGYNLNDRILAFERRSHISMPPRLKFARTFGPVVISVLSIYLITVSNERSGTPGPTPTQIP